ncbi:MAG: guanylate kinase [Pseudonocardiales bacterium]|jgi:guanylate kinase|nr:guanylate kinase [Pseudonocardiales bacterium]
MSVLLVVAGPSGVGKGSVIRRLRAADPGLWFSVSATDRGPRPGEVDGADYVFVSTEEFERMRDAGDFLEWFEVFGDLKGTPRGPIEEHLAAGDDVVVEVDVQGALAIRDAFPDALLVFVKPPSRDVQRDRLHARAQEEADRSGTPFDPEVLRRRLVEADAEEALADRFDAVVVNDDLDRALAELTGLLEARREGRSG